MEMEEPKGFFLRYVVEITPVTLFLPCSSYASLEQGDEGL